MSAVYGIEIPNHEGKAGMTALKIDPIKGFNSEEISRFVVDVLPRYSIPIFLRLRKELELTGSKKIRKANLRKEGFNIEEIDEPMYFWNSKIKKYIPFTQDKFQDIIEGKISL
jgi:hypothetical protein